MWVAALFTTARAWMPPKYLVSHEWATLGSLHAAEYVLVLGD